MIDRDTAIQWAKDAGFAVSPEVGCLGACSVSQTQALINRAIVQGRETAIKELIQAFQPLLNRVREMNDIGPAGYEYQSDALIAEIQRVEEAIKRYLA